jgi:U3 small nucleolar RNA-associated protein 18
MDVPLFYEDRQPELVISYEALLNGNENEESSSNANNSAVFSAAWHDSDDETLEVTVTSNLLKKTRASIQEKTIDGLELQKRMRIQHNKLMGPAAAWSKAKRGQVLFGRSSVSEIQPAREGLPAGLIEVKEMKGTFAQAQSVIQSLVCHPLKDGLVAFGGLDKTLSLVDKKGKHVKNLYLPDLPIRKLQFTADGQQILITGRRPYYYCYDLTQDKTVRIPCLSGLIGAAGNRNLDVKESKQDILSTMERFVMSPDNRYFALSGKQGYIHVVSRQSRELITSYKQNNSVRSLDFSSDGTRLYSLGEEGHELYVWDLRSSAGCLNRTSDPGSLKGSVIKVSDDYVACGSASGIVNIYKTEDIDSKETVMPLKTFSNLTTYINDIQMNRQSELLCIQTKSVKNGIRLIHLPSMSVYSNWPHAASNLSYVNAIAFCPSSAMLYTGNDRGNIHKFSFPHYQNN